MAVRFSDGLCVCFCGAEKVDLPHKGGNHDLLLNRCEAF